jgi:hypothetical protein
MSVTGYSGSFYLKLSFDRRAKPLLVGITGNFERLIFVDDWKNLPCVKLQKA